MEREKIRAIIDELIITLPELHSMYQGALEMATGCGGHINANPIQTKTIEADDFFKIQDIGSAMLKIKRESEIIDGIIERLELDPFLEPEQMCEVLSKFIEYYINI